MKLNRRSWFLAAASAPSVDAECIQIGEPQSGELEVTALDSVGSPIANLAIQVEGFERRYIRAGENRVRLPYGRHRVSVSAPGFEGHKADVDVYTPSVTLRVELRVGSLGCPPGPALIGGVVQGLTHDVEAWVKMVALRGSDCREARIERSGKFLLASRSYSDYLLVVVQGKRVLHSRVIHTDPMSAGALDLSIDLRPSGERKSN